MYDKCYEPASLDKIMQIEDPDKKYKQIDDYAQKKAKLNAIKKAQEILYQQVGSVYEVFHGNGLNYETFMTNNPVKTLWEAFIECAKKLTKNKKFSVGGEMKEKICSDFAKYPSKLAKCEEGKKMLVFLNIYFHNIMAELHDQLSQYIGFEPSEICLPITEEKRQRGATILTSGQIEEIRHLKNKALVYMIVNKYHINKDRVNDIWNDYECSQQNGIHFFEELKKVQFISSVPPLENDPHEKENNHPIVESLKSLELITRELSSSSRTLHFLSSLRQISTKSSCQNSLLDISYDLIASIETNHIKAKEAIRKSEKHLAHNSSFSPLYSAKLQK
ncbi:hypothetical protein C2G38_2199925 [Gigaspora rosea]|uniref:Uncharacterized protein n=1 Tax=Gigaspora rosea TaxID=44941 RepID=A0A397UZX6_9GLOM|nr:hypothetical protein C2G38_2199925 [Gigaspora rosea]